METDFTSTQIFIPTWSDSAWSAGVYVENLTDELYPVQGNASLATLGYAEIIYARERNVYASLTYNFD